jgi:sigma-B regulation protein RsbU (phosphoserine phosphatase)
MIQAPVAARPWLVYAAFFAAFVVASAGVRGVAMMLTRVDPGLWADAPVALALAWAFWAWQREQAPAAPVALVPDAGPDFRDIVGGFAAASRESLDVPSTADAFMDAVDGALGPAYQLVTVKRPDGAYEPIAARRVADPARKLREGPAEEDVVIPLKVGERAIGRLLLGPRRQAQEYAPADYGLLDSLGQSLALSVRNAQLFRELAEQERLKRELEIAYDVQMGLLPKTVPTPTGAALAAMCVPALEVGGDLYDFVQIDATRWGVLIGDVSGKGVPASLMMAVSLTLFRALAPGIPSPASTLGRLNKLIHRNRPSNKIFVAAVYLIYDARDGSALIANAGHPPPMLDGEAVAIKGLPLGVSAKTVYKEIRVQLPPGATLAVYSDGLEDAEDEAGTPFGPARVADFFRRSAGQDPQAALAALREELARFAGRAHPPDDQTVAVLRRSPDPAGTPVP